MWFLLSISSALFDAVKNVLAKKELKKNTAHPIVLAWAWVFYALPVVVPMMFWQPLPALDTVFWVAFATALILDYVSIVMFVKSIDLTDLSLSLPMLAAVPLTLLLSGFLLSGEFPNLIGLSGVALVIIGAYLLNYKRHISNWYDPFLAIFKNQGSLLMLGVAVIWGVSSAVHKVAIVHSSPFFYAGMAYLGLAALYTPTAYFVDKKNFLASFKWKTMNRVAPIGIFDGLSILAQFIGQSLTFSVFVIAIKRTSIVWASLASAVMFKEKIKDRIVPICLMLIGVLAIAFSQVEFFFFEL